MAANFVRIIEEYPCLYNNKLAEYSRKDVTDKAWSEVSQKTNASVSDCQTRWRNIRNGFVRSLKPTPSGSSTKQKKLYYLHDELQFVLPFVKATIHIGEPDNIPSFLEVETVNIKIENISNSSTNEEPAPQSTFKRPKISKVANEADKAFVDWMKRKETKKDKSRKMFLLSLLSDVESLSDEQMRQFRIKVLLLLEDIQSGSSQQLQPYRDNYSPIQHSEHYKDYSSNSSAESNSNIQVSSGNYSGNTNFSHDSPELQNLENL